MIKINPAKALKIGGALLTVVSTVVNAAIHANDLKAVKAEVKADVLKELVEKK